MKKTSQRIWRWLNSPTLIVHRAKILQTYNKICKKICYRKKKSKSEFLYGIFLVSNKNHVGNIKIGPINKIHKTTFISYFIGNSKLRSKGIMSEAFNQIFNLAKKFKIKKFKLEFMIKIFLAKNIKKK